MFDKILNFLNTHKLQEEDFTLYIKIYMGFVNFNSIILPLGWLNLKNPWFSLLGSISFKVSTFFGSVRHTHNTDKLFLTESDICSWRWGGMNIYDNCYQNKIRNKLYKKIWQIKSTWKLKTKTLVMTTVSNFHLTFCPTALQKLFQGLNTRRNHF